MSITSDILGARLELHFLVISILVAKKMWVAIPLQLEVGDIISLY